MIVHKKRLLMILFVISFAISAVLGLGRMNAFSEPFNTDAPVLNGHALIHAPGTYFRFGTIININDSSITLYHDTTYIIAASTICKAPPAGKSIGVMRIVSCSYFTRGQTVSIAAKKNTAGNLVATEINRVFY